MSDRRALHEAKKKLDEREENLTTLEKAVRALDIPDGMKPGEMGTYARQAGELYVSLTASRSNTQDSAGTDFKSAPKNQRRVSGSRIDQVVRCTIATLRRMMGKPLGYVQARNRSRTFRPGEPTGPNRPAEDPW